MNHGGGWATAEPERQAKMWASRAEQEMVEGYMDGREPNNPEPSDNRSRAYRHGFQSGRDDLARKMSAPFEVRRKQAEEILAEDTPSAAIAKAEGRVT